MAEFKMQRLYGWLKNSFANLQVIVTFGKLLNCEDYI